MFSKKKKPDANAGGAAPAAPDAAAATPDPAAAAAAAAAPAAPSPGLEEGASPETQTSGGGLLSAGLGAKSKSSGSVAASRLGGRPPSRPSAPAPEPAPAPPPPPPEPVSTPAYQSMTLPPGTPAAGFTSTGQGLPPADAEMSKSGRMQAIAGLPQEVATVAEGVAGKGKNPYKLNFAFDVLLPLGMCVVLCGGFAATTKIVKDKHEIYPQTDAERLTQVRDQYLASAKIMDDVKKMDPVVKLDAGDTAGAMTEAKDMGAKALQIADQQGMGAPQKGSSTHEVTKDETNAEEKAVRELLAAGIVMSKVGSKQDKDLGLTYMSRAQEIATYSKYVRILFARELVRQHRDDEAISQYEKILELFTDPWNLPHKELAYLYMRANHGAEAVKELQYLMKNDSADPSYQRELGLAMAQNNDMQTGFEEFQKGFTHEQDVLNYPAAVKGLVEAHGGLVDATLADIKKAADKNPGDMKLQLDLARLYIATSKFKEARDVMEAARKAKENDPEVHEVMAEVMCRQNQQTSGYDEFRSAVQNLHLRD